MSIEKLFFELIQVAIGTRACLSHSPTAEEWKGLYDAAKKQCLVGVCFAGVLKLVAQQQEPPEMQYLTWMGLAAKIQQRNEVVNRQCAELQAKLAADGFKSCVLKGQGVGQQYAEHLRGLRQSGDIDVLMWKDGLSEEENRKAVIAYAQSIDRDAKASEHHIAVGLFPDTEVEMHYAPAYFCNPFANKRFKKWCEESKVRMEKVKVGDGEFDMPSVEFNLVFLLAHTFRHYMSEGVGLRQLMDYYFVLKELDKKACGEKGFAKKAVLTKTEKTAAASAESQNEPLANDRSSEIENTFSSSANQSFATLSGSADTSAKNSKNILETLDSLNMLKFAGAVMWVIAHVFANDNHNDDDNFYFGIKLNERLGRKLLAHVMQGGNFGHHNMDTVASKESHVGRFVNQLTLDLSLGMDYPSEALWSPISMIREFLRIRL